VIQQERAKPEATPTLERPRKLGLADLKPAWLACQAAKQAAE
jgi:hypothetical protein